MKEKYIINYVNAFLAITFALAIVIFSYVLVLFFFGILAGWTLFLCSMTFHLTKSIGLTALIMTVYAVIVFFLLRFVRKNF